MYVFLFSPHCVKSIVLFFRRKISIRPGQTNTIRFFEQCTRLTSVWCAIFREIQYMLIAYSRWHIIFAAWHFVLFFIQSEHFVNVRFVFCSLFRVKSLLHFIHPLICQSVKGAQTSAQPQTQCVGFKFVSLENFVIYVESVSFHSLTYVECRWRVFFSFETQI